MEFNENQWKELITMVKDSDKELMLLTNDLASIEFVSSFNPDVIELHSTCLNVPQLQKALKDNLSQDIKVMDATAISLAKDRSLPIIIFSILNASNIIDIIEGKGSYSIIK